MKLSTTIAVALSIIAATGCSASLVPAVQTPVSIVSVPADDLNPGQYKLEWPAFGGRSPVEALHEAPPTSLKPEAYKPRQLATFGFVK